MFLRCYCQPPGKDFGSFSCTANGLQGSCITTAGHLARFSVDFSCITAALQNSVPSRDDLTVACLNFGFLFCFIALLQRPPPPAWFWLFYFFSWTHGHIWYPPLREG
ncbi:hypothetical protein GOODEAATRI_029021 [Goodea atripinnis]|uniref:Uncharacterized protein n=1 Tax=Goodea atripinnis TaxID=208336 RepID=A0ABV0PHZ8_9TELE